MRTRLILATLAAAVALVGCDYTAVDACNKRKDPGCRTIWVEAEHRFR